MPAVANKSCANFSRIARQAFQGVVPWIHHAQTISSMLPRHLIGGVINLVDPNGRLLGPANIFPSTVALIIVMRVRCAPQVVVDVPGRSGHVHVRWSRWRSNRSSLRRIRRRVSNQTAPLLAAISTLKAVSRNQRVCQKNGRTAKSRLAPESFQNPSLLHAIT